MFAKLIPLKFLGCYVIMYDSLFDLYEKYRITLDKQQLANLHSCLIRYTLPGWGFIPSLRSKHRLDPEDLEKAKDFMKGISFSQVSSALNVQQSIFEQQKVNPSLQKTRRSYLKKFLDWIAKEYAQEQTKKESPLPRSSRKRKAKVSKPSKLTSRGKTTAISLGKVKGDIINPNLQKELNDFQKFCQDELNTSDSSVQSYLDIVLLFLGFWIRYFKYSPETLSLKDIIPYVKLFYKIGEFDHEKDSYIKYCIKRQQALDEHIERSNQLIEKLKEYWNVMPQIQNYKGYSGNRKSLHIATLINLSKFIYHQDVASQDDDYTVLYLIRKLHRESHNLKDQIKKDKQKREERDRYTKNAKWEQILQVVENLRQDSLIERYNTGVKRPARRIATSLQRFLMMALLTLIPPDRQQIIRTLVYEKDPLSKIANPDEKGNYLVYGYFDENDYFTPSEKLEDPKKAQWYLYERAYKTAKTYGTMIINVPDYLFNDGTTFYQYLDQWLFSQEDILSAPMKNRSYNLRASFKPISNTLFIKPRTSKSHYVDSVYNMVKTIFQQELGLSINPHYLRTIFATYLDQLEMEGVITSAQREVIAQTGMKHSIEQQKKTYTRTSNTAKANTVSNAHSKITGLNINPQNGNSD